MKDNPTSRTPSHFPEEPEFIRGCQTRIAVTPVSGSSSSLT